MKQKKYKQLTLFEEEKEEIPKEVISALIECFYVYKYGKVPNKSPDKVPYKQNRRIIKYEERQWLEDKNNNWAIPIENFKIK